MRSRDLLGGIGPWSLVKCTLALAVNHPNQDPAHGIGGIHPAWDIIIPKLDSKSQMKISQLNQHLAEIVKMNAESKLRKYRRQIQENKYM